MTENYTETTIYIHNKFKSKDDRPASGSINSEVLKELQENEGVVKLNRNMNYSQAHLKQDL